MMNSKLSTSFDYRLQVDSPILDVLVLLQVQYIGHLLFLFQMIYVFGFLGLRADNQIVSYQCVVHA